MVNEIRVVCGRRKLKIYMNKSKVMKVSKSGEYAAIWGENGGVRLLSVHGRGSEFGERIGSRVETQSG